MWPDIHWRIVLEADSVMAAPLLCLLMMFMKSCNLHINCCVLVSVACCQSVSCSSLALLGASVVLRLVALIFVIKFVLMLEKS